LEEKTLVEMTWFLNRFKSKRRDEEKRREEKRREERGYGEWLGFEYTDEEEEGGKK